MTFYLHFRTDHDSPTGTMLRFYLLVFVVMLLGLSGCQTAHYRASQLPVAMRAPQTRHTNDINLASMASEGTNSSQIGSGDLVEITIASGDQSEIAEPMQARVSEQGKIALPLMGDIDIAGMEPFEAGQRIRAAAIDGGIYRQPSVVLRVAEKAVNRVTVLGAVNEPGVYELPRGSSDLLGALAAAGGLSEEASTHVEVMRHENPSFLAETGRGANVVQASYEESDEAPVSLASKPDSMAGGDHVATSQLRTERINLAEASPRHHVDYSVRDSDVVMVRPLEKRTIHVAGLVNTPNQFELPPDQEVHVLDAIAMAGGVKSPVANKVYVIRQMESMREPAVIEVSIAQAKKDGRENLLLTSGDLVSVESTVLTSSFEALSTFFRVGLSLGGNVVAF